MWGRGLGHVCREGMGQPGTGVSLQAAPGCPELRLAAGVPPWHTPATWAQVCPYSVSWDTWGGDWAQWSPRGTYWDPLLGTGISTWPRIAAPRAVVGHGVFLTACSRTPEAAARRSARSPGDAWLDPGVGQVALPVHRPCTCRWLVRGPRRGARRGRGCRRAGEELAAHGAPGSIQA